MGLKYDTLLREYCEARDAFRDTIAMVKTQCATEMKAAATRAQVDTDARLLKAREATLRQRERADRAEERLEAMARATRLALAKQPRYEPS